MTSLRGTGGLLSRATTGRPRHVRRALGSGNLTRPSIVTVLDNTRHNAFGGGYQRLNGDLVSVWREGPFHAAVVGENRGTIHQSISTDNGVTWGTPTVLYDDTVTELDARDPTVMRTAAGTLILTFFLHAAGTGPATLAQVLRSTNDGQSWSSPIPVYNDFASGNPVSNPAVQLANGDLLVPVYGRWVLGGGNVSGVYVARSQDDGLTWGNPSTVIDGYAEGNLRDYQEPGLDVDPWTGHILCVMRTSETNFYTARSMDNGATWSAPADIGFSSNGRPCLGRTTRGGLVLMYRAASDMRLTTTWDHGVTWETTVSLDNSDSQKSAYAQIVEVATDTLAVFYFMQQAEERADARFTYLTYPPATPPALGSP